MKQFIISVCSVLLVFAVWGCIYFYSYNQISEITDDLDNKLIPMIENDDFDNAIPKMEVTKTKIKRFISVSKYFIDSQELLDITQTLEKSSEFIKAKDVSNSSGEVASLSKGLNYMLEAQSPKLNNVF